uniref:Uncharacterized protein n=1 Tax=Salmo trutta TaxID=8032 RepID=A0A673ZC54_SALTR
LFKHIFTLLRREEIALPHRERQMCQMFILVELDSPHISEPRVLSDPSGGEAAQHSGTRRVTVERDGGLGTLH